MFNASVEHWYGEHPILQLQASVCCAQVPSCMQSNLPYLYIAEVDNFCQHAHASGLANVTGGEAWFEHKLLTQANVLQQQRHVLTFLRS